jgi:hypothetical protein
LIDHARALALAEAQIVQEAKAHLPEPADPLRDAGQKRRQRGLPSARHDQRGAVVPFAEALRQRGVLGVGKALARKVDDDGLPQFGHVVGERRAERGREDVHGAGRKSGFQKLHDRVAAHEVADPHVRDDQNRPPV